MTLTGKLKNAVLPVGETKIRRLPRGIGRGVRIGIDFADHTKLYLGLYEVELNRHLRRLCQPGMAAFDVGAQHGYDALVLATLNGATHDASGKVVTFECDERAIPQLRRNLAANPRLASRITLVERAVGDVTDDGRGFITLDDAADRFGPPQFVKIDIEGSEAAALRGARRLLAATRPSFVIETHDADVERECVQLLRDAGYQPQSVEPRRWLPDRRLIAHNRWLIAESPTP